VKTIEYVVSLLLLNSIAVANAQQNAVPAAADPSATEVWEPVPKAVTIDAEADSIPSDAIVLFDGSSLDEWESIDGSPAEWEIADGVLTVVTEAGDIRTVRSFGDVQLHLEWLIPRDVEGRGQGRGNSGIYLQELYEIQVLDSFDNPTYVNGQAASVYKQYVPLVNASRRPGVWQTYDIIYRAPKFTDSGAVSVPARVTVLHNGILVQDSVPLWGPTEYIGLPRYKAHGDAPLRLQAHGSGSIVNFRNIWVRRL